MPQSSIQTCFDTNWNPASPVSNWTSSQMLSAAVKIVDSSPTSLTISGRRRLATSTQNAPITGLKISAVRMGNPGAGSCTTGSL